MLPSQIENKMPYSKKDIAEYIAKVADGNFVYAKGDGMPNVWFWYNDHKWNQCHQNISFKIFIHKEMEKLGIVLDPNCMSFIVRLCEEMMGSDTFYDFLDSNLDLLGCKNGVYDLKEKCFRAGRKSDFISLSTGVEIKDVDEDSEEFKQMIAFLDTVFPNGRRQFMVMAQHIFFPRHKKENKAIYQNIGGYLTGKSTAIRLLKEAFGDYVMNVPKEIFTAKKYYHYQLREITRACIIEEIDGEEIDVITNREIISPIVIVIQHKEMSITKFKRDGVYTVPYETTFSHDDDSRMIHRVKEFSHLFLPFVFSSIINVSKKKFVFYSA